MVLGHDHDQLLFERHQRLEGGEVGRPKNDHQVDFVGRQRRHRPFVVDHLQVE